MVGAVIGNYQLVRKLGEGGMGAVYLGKHQLLGRLAAIKVLLPALSARSDVVNRFFNEARAVTSISDPGIVQVFDFGYHVDGSAFIVMEFLEGEPLDRRLARSGTLAVRDVLLLGRQLSGSLAAAHAQRIVHRDLKPENIFLVPDAETTLGERAKILDFGIAKLSDDHPGKIKTSTGMLVGTPTYMSPEQCRGLPDVDQRSDIYSLGCVLLHLLTGRPPFEGEAPGDIIAAHIREPAPAPSTRSPRIPREVDDIVLRCLAKSPAARYQTMAELGAALAGALLRVPAAEPSVASHLLPTAKVALQPASAVPTTLGASTGQLLQSSRHPRRLAMWIVTGFVIGGALSGLAIVVLRAAAPGAMPPSNTAASSPGSFEHRGGGPPPLAVDAGVVFAPDVPRDAAVAVAPDMPRDAAVVARGAAIDAAEARRADAGASETSRATPSDDARRDTGQGAERPQEPGNQEPRRHRKVAQVPAASAPPQHPAPAAGSASQPARCARSVFAEVYGAAAPPNQQVQAALRTLNACHALGTINDSDFEEIEAALVTKL